MNYENIRTSQSQTIWRSPIIDFWYGLSYFLKANIIISYKDRFCITIIDRELVWK